MHRCQVNRYKDALHHVLSGRHTLEQQYSTYTFISMAKSRTLEVPNAAEDVEQQKHSLIAGKCNHFEVNFGVFLQN